MSHIEAEALGSSGLTLGSLLACFWIALVLDLGSLWPRSWAHSGFALSSFCAFFWLAFGSPWCSFWARSRLALGFLVG